MNGFPEPNIVSSRCIEFESCRWNGLRISSGAVKILRPLADFTTVCPEVEIGLGVPRPPVRVVRDRGGLRLLQDETGADLTDRMRSFADAFLDGLGEVDGFILKERSPSCGMKNVKVYPGLGKTGPLHARGAGFFGAAVIGRFPDTPVEDEGRLNNYGIREHFFTRLFTLARFREVRRSGSMGALVAFHTACKFLLMAHSEGELRALGALVANRPRRRAAEALAEYERGLRRALRLPPKPGACVNVLMHALGHVSRGISGREKAFLLDALRRYRAGRVPLSAPVAVVRSLIVRFEEPYLAGQLFFAPFPEELVEVSDSGKGRELWR
ncbi:MAG: DUF1722 domain-containing protein [bacterium]|nr:DUF1722 domain-containing protein [bacterium]